MPHFDNDEQAHLHQLLAELRHQLAFDASILGTGRRAANGTIDIRKYLLQGLEPDFVPRYQAIASNDAAAQLFLMCPSNVITISLDDYRDLTRNATGAAVRKYLQSYRIRSVMLTGVDTSHGIAWLTLYRLDRDSGAPAPQAFNAYEREFAAHVIRARLYQWQRRFRQRAEAMAGEDFRFFNVSPAVLEVAMWSAYGHSAKREPLKTPDNRDNTGHPANRP